MDREDETATGGPRGARLLGVAAAAVAALWLGKGLLMTFVGLPLAAQVLQLLGALYVWEVVQAALGRDVRRLTLPPLHQNM